MLNLVQKSIIRTLIKASSLILFIFVPFLPLSVYGFEYKEHPAQGYLLQEAMRKDKKFHIHPKILGNNKRKHHNREKYRILDYNNIGIALRFNIDF